MISETVLTMIEWAMVAVMFLWIWKERGEG